MCMDNLARDCIEMKRLGYGCHYGKYKADHPSPVAHREEFFFDEEEDDTAVCPTCGIRFRPIRCSQIYCGALCQSRRYYQKRKEAKGDPKKANCPVCGKEFQVWWGRKYCSETCQRVKNAEIRREKRRERNGN